MKKFWTRHKKIILAVAGLILIASFGFRFFGEKPPKYSLSKVERGTLTQTVSASGKTRAQNQVDLKFQTSGLLTWVGVKEGDYVYQWQGIASLDRRELERRLLKALRDYSKTRWDFEEAQQVTYKDRILTDTIKRILEKNQFDLDKAVADVEIVDIALKLSSITTPIAGIVTHVETPVAGVNVSPATATFTIIDPKTIIFSVNIDEADIGKISLNQPVKIILDAYPNQEFSGKVLKIGFAAVTTTGGGTAFSVEVGLPENNLPRAEKFKVGMNGDAQIITQEKQNTLFLPASAIFTEKEKNYVWKSVDGRTIKQEVKIGIAIEEKTEILEGLTEGENIITGELGKIREGQKIK